MTQINDAYNPESGHEYQTRLADIARKEAYANPLNGSDRLFSEAARMKCMGEAGWENKEQEAVLRYEEIRISIPWPSQQS